jgi:hypothetical protein
MLIIAPPDMKAGPFRDFFRSLRSAFTQPETKEKPRRHRKTHKHNETPPSDASNSQTLGSPVSSPSDQREIRWAKTATDAIPQNPDLPYGTTVFGKPGLVTSPFVPDSGYVEVTGFPRGTTVEDPYTGKFSLRRKISVIRLRCSCEVLGTHRRQSALDSECRTIWIADVYRDGKRFVVRTDEKLTVSG